MLQALNIKFGVLYEIIGLYPSIILLIPPLAILLILPQLKNAKSIADVLLPSCTDETSPQYFQNLRTIQDSLMYAIGVHEKLTRQLMHVNHYDTRAQLLIFAISVLTSSVLWIFGTQLVLILGCLVLVRHTWIWTMVQTVFGVILETIQVMVDVAGGLGLVNKNPTRAADPENLEISIFENQRWWAGSGFTGQVCHANHDGMLYSMHWVSKISML